MYRSVTGKSPPIIKDLESYDCEEQNQGLIFDEAISGNLSHGKKKKLQDKIKTWLENVSTGETKFIIFTSVEDRKSTFTYLTSAVSDIDLKIINLNDRLTIGDRTQILYSHSNTFCPNEDFSKIEDLAERGKNKSLGYPEVCALFCRCDEFHEMNAVKFCRTPLRFLKLYLEEISHSKQNKSLMLVYMSLNQMEIDLENPNEMLFNELETCKSNDLTQAELVQHGRVEDIHSLLSWGFVDKIPKTNKYKLQHDVIKRMTLIVFWNLSF